MESRIIKNFDKYVDKKVKYLYDNFFVDSNGFNNSIIRVIKMIRTSVLAVNVKLLALNICMQKYIERKDFIKSYSEKERIKFCSYYKAIIETGKYLDIFQEKISYLLDD